MGADPDQFGQLLGGAVLALSFWLLFQRRLAAAVTACAAQCWAVAAATAWQGWAQGSPALGLAGLLVAGGGGVALPLALRRMAGALRFDAAMATRPGRLAVMAAGAALAVLAVLLAAPHDALAPALAVVLLGQLMMIVWRPAPAQLIGFLSMLSGVVLALAGGGAVLPAAVLTAAVLALAAAAVGGVFALRLRAGLEDVDAGRPGGAGR